MRTFTLISLALPAVLSIRRQEPQEDAAPEEVPEVPEPPPEEDEKPPPPPYGGPDGGPMSGDDPHGESMHGMEEELNPVQMCFEHFCGDMPSEICQAEHEGQCGLFDLCCKETADHGSPMHHVIMPCAVLAVCTHADLTPCDNLKGQEKLECLASQAKDCGETIFHFGGHDDSEHLEHEMEYHHHHHDDDDDCRDCHDGPQHHHHDEHHNEHHHDEQHYDEQHDDDYDYDEDEDYEDDEGDYEQDLIDHCMGQCESVNGNCPKFMDQHHLTCEMFKTCSTDIAPHFEHLEERELTHRCMDFSSCLVNHANGEIEAGAMAKDLAWHQMSQECIGDIFFK